MCPFFNMQHLMFVFWCSIVPRLFWMLFLSLVSGSAIIPLLLRWIDSPRASPVFVLSEGPLAKSSSYNHCRAEMRPWWWGNHPKGIYTSRQWCLSKGLLPGGNGGGGGVMKRFCETPSNRLGNFWDFMALNSQLCGILLSTQIKISYYSMLC